MKKLTYSGFSAIEALLILVILSIIGFTGFYVLHSKHSVDTSLNNTNKTSSNSFTTPAKSKSNKSVLQPTPAKAVVHTAAEANDMVQNALKTYSATVKTSSSTTTALQAIKPQLSEAFYNNAANHLTDNIDPIVCTSNYYPDSVTATTTSKDLLATSLVTRIANGQTASAKITVTSDLASLKITAISCPN